MVGNSGIDLNQQWLTSITRDTLIFANLKIIFEPKTCGILILIPNSGIAFMSNSDIKYYILETCFSYKTKINVSWQFYSVYLHSVGFCH